MIEYCLESVECDPDIEIKSTNENHIDLIFRNLNFVFVSAEVVEIIPQPLPAWVESSNRNYDFFCFNRIDLFQAIQRVHLLFIGNGCSSS